MISVRSAIGRSRLSLLLATVLLAIPVFPLEVQKSQGTHGNEGPCIAPEPYAITGVASNYPGTAGWMGEATVALPLALGGCYVGKVHGYVRVCGDRCATLPVVDFCQCYWATPDQRVVDLSYSAWALVSRSPLGRGLVEVTVTYGSQEAQRETEATPPGVLPNTAMASEASRKK